MKSIIAVLMLGLCYVSMPAVYAKEAAPAIDPELALWAKAYQQRVGPFALRGEYDQMLATMKADLAALDHPEAKTYVKNAISHFKRVKSHFEKRSKKLGLAAPVNIVSETGAVYEVNKNSLAFVIHTPKDGEEGAFDEEKFLVTEEDVAVASLRFDERRFKDIPNYSYLSVFALVGNDGVKHPYHLLVWPPQFNAKAAKAQ